MSALLLLILATYRPPVVLLAVQDTGFGHCGMDSHPHEDLTICYRDSDDSPLRKVTDAAPRI